ncbi:Armadillo-type_fold [Hexamita inflata]|uniref:Armadillo-type fold n=1 Tax=Hexamita inflata TaxID=28002 RepID=A0AA86QUU2_9EUKA|nr:Armadillo-type fold [Hexamita inflata]
MNRTIFLSQYYSIRREKLIKKQPNVQKPLITQNQVDDLLESGLDYQDDSSQLQANLTYLIQIAESSDHPFITRSCQFPDFISFLDLIFDQFSQIQDTLPYHPLVNLIISFLSIIKMLSVSSILPLLNSFFRLLKRSLHSETLSLLVPFLFQIDFYPEIQDVYMNYVFGIIDQLCNSLPLEMKQSQFELFIISLSVDQILNLSDTKQIAQCLVNVQTQFNNVNPSPITLKCFCQLISVLTSAICSNTIYQISPLDLLRYVINQNFDDFLMCVADVFEFLFGSVRLQMITPEQLVILLESQEYWEFTLKCLTQRESQIKAACLNHFLQLIDIFPTLLQEAQPVLNQIIYQINSTSKIVQRAALRIVHSLVDNQLIQMLKMNLIHRLGSALEENSNMLKKGLDSNLVVILETINKLSQHSDGRNDLDDANIEIKLQYVIDDCSDEKCSDICMQIISRLQM